MCPPVQMLDDKFTLLYFELAEGSGLKFIRDEAQHSRLIARHSTALEHGARCGG